jgi:hypothetical protein
MLANGKPLAHADDLSYLGDVRVEQNLDDCLVSWLAVSDAGVPALAGLCDEKTG